MKLGRREFVTTTVGAAAYALFAPAGTVQGAEKMYGLIGKMIAVDYGAANMPGCISYIVAKDLKEADGIWVTEVWDSKESHANSLELPAVKDAIAKGRPMIKSFDIYHETEPVGGQGLRRK